MMIDDLLSANEAFRAAREFHGLQMMPRRRMLVIGCADPRVDPEKILGLRLGDAAVIRNIGGRITPATLATIEGLAALGAPAAHRDAGQTATGMDLVLLQHTDCGIRRLAQQQQALARFLGIDTERLRSMNVDDPYAAVGHDIAMLRRALPASMRVWGLIYDVTSGRVDRAEQPQELGS
jgi:carbonic anhydrase